MPCQQQELQGEPCKPALCMDNQKEALLFLIAAAMLRAEPALAYSYIQAQLHPMWQQSPHSMMT